MAVCIAMSETVAAMPVAGISAVHLPSVTDGVINRPFHEKFNSGLPALFAA